MGKWGDTRHETRDTSVGAKHPPKGDLRNHMRAGHASTCLGVRRSHERRVDASPKGDLRNRMGAGDASAGLIRAG